MKKLLTLATGLLLSATAFAQQKYLVIDAGHGGEDAGAIAATGMAEKNFNLQMAQALRKEAAAAGYTVEMTREDDRSMSPEDRVALRNRYKMTNSHFVSIHMEAATNDTAKGILVHYDEKSAPSSASWRQKLISTLQPLGNVRTSTAGLVVLRGSGSIPSLSVSPGYITNSDDLARISDPAYLERVAKAIVASLE